MRHQTGWSKKSLKTEIAMGRWFRLRYDNIRGQELEEGRPRQRRMGKASKEGQGPPRAVGPMMMMMMMICAGPGFGLVADLASKIQMICLFHYRGGGLSLPCKRHFTADVTKVICTINAVTRHH